MAPLFRSSRVPAHPCYDRVNSIVDAKQCQCEICCDDCVNSNRVKIAFALAVTSSTKEITRSLTWFSTTSWIFVIYITNNAGEVGEPYGRPVVTSVDSPSWPSTLIMTRLSLMKLSVHLMRPSSRLIRHIFRSRHPFATPGKQLQRPQGGPIGNDAASVPRLLGLSYRDPNRVNG